MNTGPVKGVWEAGAARPTEPVEAHEGQQVIITFLDEEAPEQSTDERDLGWEARIA